MSLIIGVITIFISFEIIINLSQEVLEDGRNILYQPPNLPKFLKIIFKSIDVD